MSKRERTVWNSVPLATDESSIIFGSFGMDLDPDPKLCTAGRIRSRIGNKQFRIAKLIMGIEGIPRHFLKVRSKYSKRKAKKFFKGDLNV